MTLESLLPWLALKRVPGLGNVLYRRLLKRFGSPLQVLQADGKSLLCVKGMQPRVVAGIRQTTRDPHDADRREIEATLQKGHRIITCLDDEYPELLRRIADPPPFLYIAGQLDVRAVHIAVVGSRNPTEYGLSTTRSLCSELASAGITIVSGLARGIDTAAHEGALMGQGRTIAVLGSGLACVYPFQNRALAERIAQKGAVISEFPLNAEPEGHHFPARNRIISGLSYGTVVVEATTKSGSLITSRLAVEQNREVFAVPGSIHSFKSTGTHNLLKQGATLVMCARDIIDEIAPITGKRFEGRPDRDATRNLTPDLLPDEAAVFGALGPYPLHIDELTRKLSMEAGRLAGLLLQLELKGVVRQMPGKMFCQV